MIRVPVAVEPRPYEALIQSGLLSRAGAHLHEILRSPQCLFVVTVSRLRSKWAKTLLASLGAAGFAAKLVEMPDGEPHKRLATIENLAEKLAKLGADRGAVILALGGGVVGDVAGMLASLYMRGVDVIQVPTTLVAQVDASVGGKTGVNLRAGKNLLGTFHQPRAVLIDPLVLSTLPRRQFQAGLYEALKCGVIGNPELFQRFEDSKDKVLRRDEKILEQVIADSVRLKAQIVATDERESGLRRVLNFGHTIGHALEAEGGYRGLLHGEAVAWGMIAATNIALNVQRLDSVTAGRITDAVLGLGRLPRVSARSSHILARLQADKKTKDGVVHFVLPTAIGKVEVVNDVQERVVLAAVDELRRLSKT